MNIIKITTNNEISIHSYPTEIIHEENKALRQLIGNNCRIFEHVMPQRLYSELGAPSSVTNIDGECISMLIDEEGLLKPNSVNLVGSFLYESDKHANPIAGNVLIVGEKWEEDGISFCGIAEEQFNLIYPKLKALVEKAGEYR